MPKSRLEAFSDGVIAIMVLELKVPHGQGRPESRRASLARTLNF
jgi:uncharacterized membrane protein